VAASPDEGPEAPFDWVPVHPVDSVDLVNGEAPTQRRPPRCLAGGAQLPSGLGGHHNPPCSSPRGGLIHPTLS